MLVAQILDEPLTRIPRRLYGLEDFRLCYIPWQRHLDQSEELLELSDFRYYTQGFFVFRYFLRMFRMAAAASSDPIALMTTLAKARNRRPPGCLISSEMLGPRFSLGSL